MLLLDEDDDNILLDGDEFDSDNDLTTSISEVLELTALRVSNGHK
jgi:hypothetical protein